MLDKNIIEKLKQQLNSEKNRITEELNDIAKPNPKLKGDWNTKFPNMSDRTAELDENADEIEEYENTLPIEYELETHLANINAAIEKIKSGKYGICENCGKEIPLERLEAVPEAKFCIEHAE